MDHLRCFEAQPLFVDGRFLNRKFAYRIGGVAEYEMWEHIDLKVLQTRDGNVGQLSIADECLRRWAFVA